MKFIADTIPLHFGAFPECLQLILSFDNPVLA